MNIFLLIFLIASVYYPKVNSSTPPNDLSTCDAKALSKNRDILKNASYDHYNPSTETTYCSPFNFKVSKCGATIMEIVHSDASIEVKIVSVEDSESGGVATCVYQTYKITQDNTLGFLSDSITKYGKVGSDDKLIEEEVPEDLKTFLEDDLIIMAMGDNAEWFLFATCKIFAAFVAFPEKIMMENKMGDYDGAIQSAIDANFEEIPFYDIDADTVDNSIVNACIPSSSFKTQPNQIYPIEPEPEPDPEV